MEGSYKFGIFRWSVSFVRPFIGISLCSQQDLRFFYQLFSDFLLEVKESKKVNNNNNKKKKKKKKKKDADWFSKGSDEPGGTKSEFFGLLTKVYSIHA